MSPIKKYRRLDYLGITASMLCAVHCSVLPLAITYGILGSGYLLGHGLFEVVFIGLSMIFAFSSLYQSYRGIHRNLRPFAMFGGGFLLILCGLYFHGALEIVMATIGGMIIAGSHFYNLRLTRQLVSCPLSH